MFTEEDKKLINDAYKELLELSKDIIRDNDDRLKVIQRSFEFANKAHWGVRRKSGEPYMLHPLSVAKIVVQEIGLGVKSVCAALLHDVVEDTDYTLEDIENIAGAKVSNMVDGLTKLSKSVSFSSSDSEQAENFKKMIFTLSDDVRVILIKIADRLHNMRTLDSMLPHKKMKIVSETLYMFAPLAHRLGLSAIKTELENLCFKHSSPKEYYEIVEKMERTSAERNEFIKRFSLPIELALKEDGVIFQISGREKSPYSIWKKMKKKGVSFEEVYDLFAIRIIFKDDHIKPEKKQCWDILSAIMQIYTPKPDRIRDWVSIPKENGYEALHCTMMSPDGVWVEVQIRTERMDDIAERGFAAHWKYKSSAKDESELDKWILKIRDVLHGSTEDAVEFLDDLKLNLYTSEIVIFTPKGENINLPKDATALDFAYSVHSKLGNSAIGAKINHQIKPIFTQLKSGDQVEIISSAKAQPKIEWMEHVVTTKAKYAIKNYFKKNHTDFSKIGKERLNDELQKYGIKQATTRVFDKILPIYKCNTKDDFYIKVGSGQIKLDNIGEVLKSSKSNKLLNFWSLDFDSVNPFKLFGVGNNKSKESSSNVNYVIAECCHPIPEDEIIAFREDDDKIIIHKKECTKAIDYAAKYGNKIVKASWSSKASMSYLCKIRLTGVDRIGILNEVSHIIATQFNVNIRNLLFETHNAVFECNIVLYVKDNSALKQLISLIQNVKGVNKVARVELNNFSN